MRGCEGAWTSLKRVGVVDLDAKIQTFFVIGYSNQETLSKVCVCVCDVFCFWRSDDWIPLKKKDIGSRPGKTMFFQFCWKTNMYLGFAVSGSGDCLFSLWVNPFQLWFQSPFAANVKGWRVNPLLGRFPDSKSQVSSSAPRAPTPGRALPRICQGEQVSMSSSEVKCNN